MMFWCLYVSTTVSVYVNRNFVLWTTSIRILPFFLLSTRPLFVDWASTGAKNWSMCVSFFFTTRYNMIDKLLCDLFSAESWYNGRSDQHGQFLQNLSSCTVQYETTLYTVHVSFYWSFSVIQYIITRVTFMPAHTVAWRCRISLMYTAPARTDWRTVSLTLRRNGCSTISWSVFEGFVNCEFFLHICQCTNLMDAHA